jgi:hypothetical protein
MMGLKLAGEAIRTVNRLAWLTEAPTAAILETAMIAIRPERLSFSTEEKKANLIRCSIANITFLGSIVRIQVRIGSLLFYMDTFNNPFLELPKVGETTQITCSKEAVLILRHSTASIEPVIVNMDQMRGTISKQNRKASNRQPWVAGLLC